MYLRHQFKSASLYPGPSILSAFTLNFLSSRFAPPKPIRALPMDSTTALLGARYLGYDA
jgi:hypothetical protein